jgi:hypothetical protein
MIIEILRVRNRRVAEICGPARNPGRRGRAVPYCADTASGAQTGPKPTTYDSLIVLAAMQETAANRLS